MTNKSILITGSSSGIGLGCVKFFQEKGWEVIGIDINEQNASIPNIFYKVDLKNIEDINYCCKDILKKNIKLDSIIHNAAMQIEKTIIETTPDEWDAVFNTNVRSIFLLTKALISCLRSNSSIINISSVHAKATSVGLASYVASKGAVSALTRAMALELSANSIRVNAILPGAIMTPMLEKGLSRNMKSDDALNKLKESSPLKKIGQPQDVANLAWFLANHSLSSNITGQEFVTDSGILTKLASE